MSDFNIEDHEWYDSDIDSAEIFSSRKDRVLIHLNEEVMVEMVHISKEDSIALAKHFGHYKEPTK